VATDGSRIPKPPSVAGRWMMGVAWEGRVICCVMVAMAWWMVMRIDKMISESHWKSVSCESGW
jgi:hypothetical protein